MWKYVLSFHRMKPRDMRLGGKCPETLSHPPNPKWLALLKVNSTGQM